MDSNVVEKKEGSSMKIVVEESKMDKEVANTERLLFAKVKASIQKREEVDQWRRYARRLEQECQRDRYWDERDRDAKAARIKANRLEREVSIIEQELKREEDCEKVREFSLKIMKEICVTKSEAAKAFREIAAKYEIEGYRLTHEINNMPPRFSPEKNLMNQDKLSEVDRFAYEVRYRAKMERVNELSRQAHETRYQASMWDAEIKRVTQKIDELVEEKAKREDIPKPVIITGEAEFLGNKKDEEYTQVEVGMKEMRKRQEEPKKHFNKSRVSWKSSKEREEENKFKTLKEYEKIAEEKKKALNAKFSTPKKVIENTVSEKENGKHIEKKSGKRMEKKVSVMDYLPVSRNSFYQRPQVLTTNNGNGREPEPRRPYTKNFGGQLNSNASKSEEFPKLI